MTTAERGLIIRTLRADLAAAREAMKANPCDETLRRVEALRDELVAAQKTRSLRERNVARRRERHA